MKEFLRFVGVIEILAYIGGIIALILNIQLTGISIFYFVLYIILGPTFAVILFSIAQILENTEGTLEKLEKIEKQLEAPKAPANIEKKQSEEENNG